MSAGDVVMVGDTTDDVEIAAAAGLASIAVTYGHHAAEVLAAAARR